MTRCTRTRQKKFKWWSIIFWKQIQLYHRGKIWICSGSPISNDQIEIGTVVSSNLRRGWKCRTYLRLDRFKWVLYVWYRGSVRTEESCLVQHQDCSSETNMKLLKHRWCLERESNKSLNYGMENRDSVIKQFNSLYDAHSTDETIWTKSFPGRTELGSNMSSVLSNFRANWKRMGWARLFDIQFSWTLLCLHRAVTKIWIYSFQSTVFTLPVSLTNQQFGLRQF